MSAVNQASNADQESYDDDVTDNDRERGFSFLTDVDEDVPAFKPNSKFVFEDKPNMTLRFLEGQAAQKKVVISLDFGSTHSGFAYAMTSGDTTVKAVLKDNGLFKEPTCALFEKTGELIAFGLQAREGYLRRLAEGKLLSFSTSEIKDYSKDVLYFDYDKMKMRLYEDKERKDGGPRQKFEDMMALSQNGDEVPLLPLVAAILARLRLDALDYIEAHENISNLVEEDCLWVLTVPAIWLEADKQFMRQAAVQAKIIPDFHSPDLILALEPECAAIRLYALRNLELNRGDKILVMDCGGGTVDFCAIEVTSTPDNRFRFRQLLEPSGGNFGATYIDEMFYGFMRKLIGKDEFLRSMLVSSCQHDIRQGWENIKLSLRAVDFQDSSKGRAIELKNLLIETKQSLPTLVKKYNAVHKHHIALKKKNLGTTTKLILTPSILRTFFDPILRPTVRMTEELVARPELSGLKNIVMVGGLGKSEYLKEQIIKRVGLPSDLIIVPQESSAIVMKGAVEFGLQPSVIESRKCALTVGVKTKVPFDPAVHVAPDQIAHKVFDDKLKQFVLKDVFRPLVLRGQEVTVNQEVTQHFTSRPGMTSIKFDIYASKKTDVHFVSDQNCVRLGKLVIPVDQKISAPQSFKCSITVGYTEMFARVVNATTGRQEQMRIEFNRFAEDKANIYNNLDISNQSVPEEEDV